MMKFFYRGKRRMPSAKKPALTILPLLLVLLLTVGGTLAFLIDSTQKVTNTFTPGSVGTEIEEEFPGQEVKQNVRIKNTGNSAAFIRAAIVANWVAADGSIVAPAAAPADYTIENLPGEGWFEQGGYYYHAAPVGAGQKTGYLFTECAPVNANAPEGADHLQVTILSQGIQATADAVNAAWPGVTVSGGQLVKN